MFFRRVPLGFVIVSLMLSAPPTRWQQQPAGHVAADLSCAGQTYLALGDFARGFGLAMAPPLYVKQVTLTNGQSADGFFEKEQSGRIWLRRRCGKAEGSKGIFSRLVSAVLEECKLRGDTFVASGNYEKQDLGTMDCCGKPQRRFRVTQR